MNCPNCKYFASCSGKYNCHYEKRSEVKEMLKEIDKFIENYYTDNPEYEGLR